ncbi:MAG: chromate transporter [Bacilli bacterium]|nr:chromate transporter [Bacilli bacterium]
MIYLKLFYEFFLIGLFTFGGGYAMIPLIKETVVNNGWLTLDEFYSFIGICESTPGPIAVNMATYIGSTQGGILGSISATLGVVLPSFIIILLIAICLKRFTKNKHFKHFIKGVKPVIVSLILFAGITLLIKCIGIDIDAFDVNINYISIVILVIITVLYFVLLKVFKKKLSSIQIILISGVLGIILSYILE